MTRYAAWKAAGLCYRCGQGEAPYCARCRDTRNAARAAARAERAAAGKCPLCGLRPPRKGGVNCLTCQTELNTYSRLSHTRRRSEYT
jgi:hypothetical protein